MFVSMSIEYLLSCHLMLIFSKYLDKCEENIQWSQKCRIINQAWQTNGLFDPFGELSSQNCRNEVVTPEAFDSCLEGFISALCLFFITLEQKTKLP